MRTPSHFRAHVKAPIATLVVVATLALGIAATTISFSLLNAIFLRPLPIREPDRVIRIYTQYDTTSQYFPISYPDFEDIDAVREVFEGAVVEQPAPFSVGVAGSHERVWGEIVSDGYFALLGVQAAAGRVFAQRDEASAEAVAVLSHGLWLRRFGGDPGVVTQSVHIDGRSFRIVGVTPEDFRGTILGYSPDLWIPRSAAPSREVETADRGDRANFAMACSSAAWTRRVTSISASSPGTW